MKTLGLPSALLFHSPPIMSTEVIVISKGRRWEEALQTLKGANDHRWVWDSGSRDSNFNHTVLRCSWCKKEFGKGVPADNWTDIGMTGWTTLPETKMGNTSAVSRPPHKAQKSSCKTAFKQSAEGHQPRNAAQGFFFSSLIWIFEKHNAFL